MKNPNIHTMLAVASALGVEPIGDMMDRGTPRSWKHVPERLERAHAERQRRDQKRFKNSQRY